MSTRRGRKYYLDAALRHVEKTGRRVERIEFAMDGSFSFVLANGESTAVSGNPWDAELVPREAAE